MPLILALRMQRQKGLCGFKASQVYIVRTCWGLGEVGGRFFFLSKTGRNKLTIVYHPIYINYPEETNS